MKKCFLNVTTVMSALLAMASFAGCSNDDTILPAGDGELKTVELYFSFPELESSTRAIGDPVSGDLDLMGDNMQIVFYDAAGLITKIKNHTWITSDNTKQTPSTYNDIPSNSVTVAVFDATNTAASATYSAAVGDWFYNTSTTSARQPLTYDTQADENSINIYGSADINKIPATWTADVKIAPTVARFEIADVSLGTGLTSFDITGVFLDDFYKDATIDGKNRVTKKAGSTSVAAYAQGQDGYQVTDAGVTYDLTTVTVDNVNIEPAAGDVWGYYAFAQPNDGAASYNHNSSVTGSEPPTFVLKIENVVAATNAAAYSGKTFYVTIKGMTYSSGGTKAVKSIMAGYVYSIPASALTINVDDLKTEPHVTPKTVKVTIEPIAWKSQVVAPVLDDDTMPA